jgi:hypothetical protein
MAMALSPARTVSQGAMSRLADFIRSQRENHE